MCTKCRAVLPAADVRANELEEAQLRRLKPASRRRPARKRPRSDLTREREVVGALTDMKAACEQLDMAVEGVATSTIPWAACPSYSARSPGDSLRL